MSDAQAGDDQIGTIAARIGGGRVSGIRRAGTQLTCTLDVAGLDAGQRDTMAAELRDALGAIDGVGEVRIAMLAARGAPPVKPLLIAVGSGKGGVGKSTLATNIALALAALGRRVGMVDADIYGPSQPRLLDAEGVTPEARDEKMVPIISPHGLPLLSMGQLVPAGQAVAWRGPMAGKALDQLIDAHWGDVDTLIVDLPPGTGDIQISMLQKHRPAGAVIVSTPQDVALIDAARAISLFQQANVPIIGMVENMAGYICPHCGEVSDPFGHGGAEHEAGTLDIPFLGRVPLTAAIRLASDAGVPPMAQGGTIAEPFIAIAGHIDRWLTDRATSKG